MSAHPSGLILVLVDDDLHIRRAIGRLLRAHGHEVHLFESAEAYLADRCEADCAIFDITLPGLSGLQLEEQLRHEGRTLPVVFITARDDLSVRAAAARIACPLIGKPLDEEGLLDAIARVTHH